MVFFLLVPVYCLLWSGRDLRLCGDYKSNSITCSFSSFLLITLPGVHSTIHSDSQVCAHLHICHFIRCHPDLVIVPTQEAGQPCSRIGQPLPTPRVSVNLPVSETLTLNRENRTLLTTQLHKQVEWCTMTFWAARCCLPRLWWFHLWSFPSATDLGTTAWWVIHTHKMRNAAQYISSSMAVSFVSVPWSKFLLTTQDGPLTWSVSLIWLHTGVGAVSHVKCLHMCREPAWGSSTISDFGASWSGFKSQLCHLKCCGLGPMTTLDWDSTWYLQNGDNNKMITAKGIYWN